MIEIKNLSKTFEGSSQVNALREINLSVEDGAICGIIGMSGAGKSTLLRCISMLEQPTGGSIEIDGQDIFKLKGAQLLKLKKSLGVVFQGYHLLMQRTIRGNIAFPLELVKTPKAEIDRRVDELLELVGLADKGEDYPPNCPAVSARGSQSRGPWQASRRCCCAMNRLARWTR